MSRTEPKNAILRIITLAICLVAAKSAFAETAGSTVQSLEAAIALDPNNVDAHLRLATTLTALSHKLDADAAAAMSARAHDEYLKVLALDPTNRGALASLSMQSMKPAVQAKVPAERAKLIAEAVRWNQRWLQSGKPDANARTSAFSTICKPPPLPTSQSSTTASRTSPPRSNSSRTS